MKPETRRIFVAAAIPLFLLFVMYAFEVLEVGMDWDFTHLGVYPRQQRGVFGIFAHAFIHSGFRHLFANTLPFFFLSWCLFYFYRDISSYILLFLWIGAGLFIFLIGKPGWHIGASGIVYGLAFFLFFSGVLRRHVPLMAISLLIAFLYGGLVWNMFPQFAKATTSWEGHFGGAITGMLAAVLFRGYGPQREVPEEEEEEEDEEEENENGEDPADDKTESHSSYSCV